MLKTLEPESVHCVVTSPPYWGLRDYGNGAAGIGLEPTVDLHIAALVEVFRETRRVLRSDGTLWLNYGDAYAGSWGAQSRGAPPSGKSTLQGNGHTGGGPKLKSISAAQINAHPKDESGTDSLKRTPGFKRKDMLGLPWRVAFALQADGWWLRQALPWVKRNPMPESCYDRPTSAIEYVFQLTKSVDCFYDYEGMKRAASLSTHKRLAQAVEAQIGSARANGGAKTNGNMKAVRAKQDGHGRRHEGFNERYDRKAAEAGVGVKNNPSMDEALAVMPETRAFRNSDLFFDSLEAPFGLIANEDGEPIALDVTTQPFTEAHFAAFPPNLVEPLIRATCPVGGTVLDVFGGAGTLGLVADRLQRNAVLIEMNPDYAAMSERRIRGDAALFAEVTR